jgi:hypothetical protein
MKKVVIKSLIVGFITMLGSSVIFSARAQSKTVIPKVYAVINRADWCPVCRANGAKVANEVIPSCKNLNVKFLSNDLTNEKTVATSLAELKKNNVLNSVKEIKSTGLIILIDGKTKKVIGKISVAAPSGEIIKEITAAQS